MKDKGHFEKKTEVDIRSGNVQGGLSAVILLAFFVLGFIVGAVIWCRSYSAADIAVFLTGFRNYCFADNMWHIVSAAAFSEFIYFGLLFLSAFFAFGWLTAFLLMLVRGMGLGVCMCCLCHAGDWKSVVICIGAMTVSSMFSVGVLIAAARESVRMSGGLYLKLHSQRAGGCTIKGYLAKSALFGILMMIAACVQAACCKIIVFSDLLSDL